MDTQVRGDPEKLSFLSAFGVTRWIDGYPLTWVFMALHQEHSKMSTCEDPLSLGVSISLHQKHSKISTFQDTLPLGYPSRYTKSTQKSQLFRIPSHLGMHLVTLRALKNLNFSGYPLT